MSSYEQLKLLFKRIYHLKNIQRIMEWDEAVMMPEGSGHTRSQVMSTLNGVIQKMLIQKNNKLLIDTAKTETLVSRWDRANLKWMEKDYHSAVCIPPKLAKKVIIATMTSEQMWRKLRAENNWTDFLPYLKTTFQLVKEVAERKSQALNLSPYDALLDEYAPGFNQNKIDAILNGLKSTLPSILKEIINKQQKNTIQIPTGLFPIEKQKTLGLTVMKALQFKFSNGRLDASHHPFCGGNPDDVRITTRYKENEFLSSLMAICHETGHARYDQGLPDKWMFQPVGHVTSMAMHESQSLLLEMEVCRSVEFIEYITPLIQNTFGRQAAFTSHNLYQLTTQVRPGLIRVCADEVTYPLHVILRYEIEKELMNNELLIDDLPARWDDLMMTYLGLSTKHNNKDGVMQDVHWPSGAFGYFPAYTLGRMIAAQLFSTFIKTHPTFLTELKIGQFQLLHDWLTQHIYENASLYSTDELLMNVTGKTLNPMFFVERIKARYLV